MVQVQVERTIAASPESNDQNLWMTLGEAA
jgi:hypothetical protein